MAERKAMVKNSFREILERFIVPLLPTNGSLKLLKSSEMVKNNTQYIILSPNNDGCFHIYPSKDSKPLFGFKVAYHELKEKDQEVKIANKVLFELLQVSPYLYYIKSFPERYSFTDNEMRGKIYLDALLLSAYELGICECLVNNLRFTKVLKSLLNELEIWAQSTYEGKRMPFGFIIDFDLTKSSNVNYIEFLRSPYSAVFSDGQFTGIMLDQEGYMVQHFITDNCNPVNPSRVPMAPYAYSKFVSLCDTKLKVGVIAQENGDILLVKDQKVVFAKRSGRWVFFPSNIIFSTISEYLILSDSDMQDVSAQAKRVVEEENKDAGFLMTDEQKKELESRTISKLKGDLKNLYSKQIYLSLLDISFNHVGGCFAIVPVPKNRKNKKSLYKSFQSDLLDYKLKNPRNASQDTISATARRKEKKAMVQSSISDDRPFYKLHRNLRYELLSLDGAVIIDMTGRVLTAGAIVEIDGGSDGGGRLAATKKLAKNGIAVKVSEDGGIEGYCRRDESEEVRCIFKVR